MSNKYDILEKMLDPFLNTVQDRFDSTFGIQAELTDWQQSEVKALLSTYDIMLELIIDKLRDDMTNYLQDEHIHYVDEYTEDCEMCAAEYKEAREEQFALESEYQRSVW